MAELDKFQKAFLLNELDHYSETIDVVLIDTGAGISRNVLFFNLAAQERIIVANGQPTSLTDAYALIKVMVTRYNQTHFKLLVNGVTQPREGEGGLPYLAPGDGALPGPGNLSGIPGVHSL